MKNGPYTLIVAPKDFPGKRYRDRYCYEHVYVYWKHRGELPVQNKTHIHHRNEIKTDNRIENLELVTQKQHRAHHRKKPNMKTFSCKRCDKKVTIRLMTYKDRLRRNKRGVFCSVSCGAGNPIKLETLTCGYCGFKFKRKRWRSYKDAFCTPYHGGMFRAAQNKKIALRSRELANPEHC